MVKLGMGAWLQVQAHGLACVDGAQPGRCYVVVDMLEILFGSAPKVM